MRRLLAAFLLVLLPAPVHADALQRGVVIGTEGRVRAEPAAASAAQATLAEGDAVLVLGRSDTRDWLGAEKDYWYRVEAAGTGAGWMHGSQLLRFDVEGRVAGSGVRLRQTPSAHGAFVQTLADGAWVTVLDRTADPDAVGGHADRWYQVRTGTTTGWVFGRFLQLALAAPGSAHAPFLGWRCWPGKAGELRPTPAQILAGLTQWRQAVDADIARRLAAPGEGDATGPTARLAAGWDALRAGAPDRAIQALAPLAALDEDAATPLGSAQAAGALFAALAQLAGAGPAEAAAAALDRALVAGHGTILTGTDWATPADLAAFDRYLFWLEQERKETRRAREWAEQVATDPAYSAVVRAAAGAASVRLHFAARRETPALVAARRVFALGAEAQVLCGPVPVHFGATALTLACDELIAVGGAGDAAALCESVVRAGDATLQAVGRARLSRLYDVGVAAPDAVIAAYEAVPDFRVRLADLRTLDAGESAARARTLRALGERVGAVDQAWVTGERVRLRAAPSRRGAVLAALGRDTVVRLLYRPPAWVADTDPSWIKVRVRGGQIGWIAEAFLELIPPRVPALPAARGMLWSQGGGTAGGQATAPGPEIDAPVILWRIPDILSGGPALGDVNGDGTADLVVTGVLGERGCPRGVAALDGATQGEVWRARTAGCTDERSVAVEAGLVVVVTDAQSVEAFDLHTGAPVWTWRAASGVRLTAPTVGRDAVAVGGTDGRLTLLDLATGRERLGVRVGSPVVVAPVLVGDVAYLVTDTHVSALDLRRRRPLWRARLIRAGSRAATAGQLPGGLTVAGDTLLAAAPTGVVIASDRATGDPRWQVDAAGTPVGGPISDGRLVMVALADGTVRAWDLADGQPAWLSAAQGPTASRMLLADHTLVIGSTDGICTGLSRVDGRVRWRLDLGVPLDRGPAGGGGRVVIGSSGGPLFVLGDAARATATPVVPLRGGPAGPS